jgi:nucleotide-binding universal stress UspA family protein
MKNILVASDFSARAEHALHRAAQLAREHRARLTALHVLDHQPRDGEPEVTTVEAQLRQHVETVTTLPPAEVTTSVRTGAPFVEIIRHARQEAADLTIVGAHGAQFLKDLFFGTTAEKIVRKGACPVLVARQTTQEPYRRIVVAVDFSSDSRAALKLALQVAPQAKYHVLYVYQGFEGQLRRGGLAETEIARHRKQWTKHAQQELETFLRDIDCHGRFVKRIVKEGRPAYVIPKTARRLRADLVAVGTTGRTGLPYLLLGSVAEHVLREVKCDVLVVRSGPIHFELP